MHTVKCPHCKKTVVWSQDFPFRPFCSERCRIIDLGAWADGSYSIPIEEIPSEDDLGEGSYENFAANDETIGNLKEVSSKHTHKSDPNPDEDNQDTNH
jgi:uncharacterized protein